MRARYAANREAINARGKELRKRPDIKRRDKNYDLKKLYNITLDDWEHMWKEQNGRCPIGDHPFLSTKDAHVDHDHGCCPGNKSCGKCVRGLICNNHNNGLGRFHDDAKALRDAADYVEKHQVSAKMIQSLTKETKQANAVNQEPFAQGDR